MLESRSTKDHEVNEILREKQVQRPVERDSDLLFEARQLAQINRTPQEPGHESREVHTENLRNASSSSKRREQSQCRERKGFRRATNDPRQDVVSQPLAFAHRVLGRCRVRSAAL